jgi:hypothetical protein
MWFPAAGVLLICLLAPCSTVLSDDRPGTDFRSGTKGFLIDGHRFDWMPSEPENDSIRRMALAFVRRGGTLGSRVSDAADSRSNALPAGFRRAHSLKFETSGVSNEIRTGTVSGPAARKPFPASKGWKYLETGGGTRFAMAINDQGGRKSIVLIDRARNKFLSITN